MKRQKEFTEPSKPQENGHDWIAENANTCIACGAVIPEGMIVCMKCEQGTESARCVICDGLLEEYEISICSRCRIVLLRLGDQDQK